MNMISINTSKCKKDGLCTMVCPRRIFIQRDKQSFPALVDPDDCIACGQCVAICPQGAVKHPAFPSNVLHPIQFERMPAPDQVMELLKTRRSIRAFRDKPIEKADIETIINGARFAPSGHNSQSTKFLVVQDRAVLDEVSATVIEYLKFEIRRFSNPFFKGMALLGNRESAESGLREIPGFQKKVRMFESGLDPILNGAPALLAFYSRQSVGYGDVNAQLALQNASLVAHSLGIGHFYTGWVIAPGRAPLARAWRQRIPSILGISPEYKLHGALALGYPMVKFKKWPERNPADTTWVGAA
jgi:nitroreductase/NAD-dependent dihydropyrimidine dehydrogenase PreA subunit